MKTTLQSIKDKHPCSDGWKKLLNHLGKGSADEEPLDFSTILESNGIEDAVWCLCTLPYKDRCLFQMEVAYKVLPLFEEKFPKDKRPREALEAAQKYYDGSIAEEELKRASKAYDAYDAYDAAAAAANAASDAASDASAAAAAAADSAAAAAAADAAADAAFWKEEITPLFIKHFTNS